MRLSEIERGDGFANRLLIRFISMASGSGRPCRPLPQEVFLSRWGVGRRRRREGQARAGVSTDALTDAIAVGSLFSIVTRYADALDFVADARRVRTCCKHASEAMLCITRDSKSASIGRGASDGNSAS
jgi:hypothetical protein